MSLTSLGSGRPMGALGLAVVLALLLNGCSASKVAASPTAPASAVTASSTPPPSVASQGSAPPSAPPVAPVPTALALTPTVVVPKTAPAPAAVSSTSLPVRVTIPSIGVDSALDKLGVDKNGVLIPPATWGRAGWFAAGTVPGDVGPALIAGHIDSTSGPAVFARLSTIKPGALVYVTQADGHRLTFQVDDGKSYPKKAFPTAVVYGPTPLRALRLVTCTGTFDHATGHYLNNYIAYAHLIA